MRRFAMVLSGCLMCLTFIACGGKVSSDKPNAVAMSGSFFQSDAITISRGDTLTFIDDPTNGTPHILVLGTDGIASSEPGAPDFGGSAGHRTDGGAKWTTGAWNTPGIYHVTCTVHPAMNLTVTVLDATATPNASSTAAPTTQATP